VPDFPRKHAHSAPAAPIARVRLRNFCFAKDRASLPHDGLLQESPTPMLSGYIVRTSIEQPATSIQHRASSKRHLTDIFMLHFIENTGIFWLIFLLAGISCKKKPSWYIKCYLLMIGSRTTLSWQSNRHKSH